MLQAEDSPCPHWTNRDAAKWRAMQAALAVQADCLWTPGMAAGRAGLTYWWWVKVS